MPIIDAHAHLRGLDDVPLYFEVAAAYGIAMTVSMSPLEEVDALRERYPGRIEFIAVPRWREIALTPAFQRSWIDDLEAFAAKGVRLAKFWMAPPMRERHGLTLDHPFVREVARKAHRMGYHFMTHIADPTVWWGGKYADAGVFGTKEDQYVQLENFLRDYPDRMMLGAHFGGSLEEPERLQRLLDAHPNYILDSSATKWIVREVARNPGAARDFVLRNADRILFGSDIVVGPKHDFDHYASRYWAHQMMWETDYRGESPIEDPDAGDPPLLAGLDLPKDVLVKLYRANAEQLLSTMTDQRV